MNYLVLLLLLTVSFFVAVTAVADLFLVAAVFADAETEDEVVSVANAGFPESIPENCML